MASFFSTRLSICLILLCSGACRPSGGKGNSVPPAPPVALTAPESCVGENLSENSCLDEAAQSLKGITDEAERVEAMVNSTVKCKPTREEFRGFLCLYNQEGK